MCSPSLLLPISDLELGRSRHLGRVEFEVLDSAGETEVHHLEVTSEVDHYGSRIHVRSQVIGKTLSHCHRCLEAFERRIETDFELVLHRGAEISEDELIAIAEEAREFDLGPYVREAVILEEPIRLLCTEECRGLCAQCGTNLNAGRCECKPPEDPRWDALKNLSERLDH